MRWRSISYLDFYVDSDGDGVGVEEDNEEHVRTPDGFPRSKDCDDNDPTRFLEALEQCDEIDNDCDGEVDEDTFHDGIEMPTMMVMEISPLSMIAILVKAMLTMTLIVTTCIQIISLLDEVL